MEIKLIVPLFLCACKNHERLWHFASMCG